MNQETALGNSIAESGADGNGDSGLTRRREEERRVSRGGRGDAENGDGGKTTKSTKDGDKPCSA